MLHRCIKTEESSQFESSLSAATIVLYKILATFISTLHNMYC